MNAFYWHKKNIPFGWSLVLTLILVIISFFLTESPTLAATNVDTFEELKSACETGGTVNITDTITATDTITISKDVVLTCSHDSESTSTDIIRAKTFHKHLFIIEEGGSLTVRCCISGGSKDSDGKPRGYGATGNTDDGYYGWALIKNTGGDLKLDSDKSVLKNNYNAITIDTDVWNYDGTKYYAFVSDDPDVTQNGLGGSAVYSRKGTFTMTNGKIYGCVGDSGVALYFASGYSADKAKISGGTIFNNIARRYGGAIFSLNRESNKITSAAAEGKGFNAPRKLNSTGSNARLTFSGGKIYNNIARLGAGAIWSGHGATFYMSGGEMYKNISTSTNSGAIRCNSGDVRSISSAIGEDALCMGLPGGQTWIAGGKIYNNKSIGTKGSNAHGGAIYASRMQLSDAEDYDEDIYYDNLFKMTGGEIFGNSAETGTGDAANGGGLCSATSTVISGGTIRNNTATGNGGGIHISATGDLEMSGGSIYSNKADGDGGGIHFVSGNEKCYITGGSIYENEATNGGGVASNRTKGLYVNNVEIYDNIASDYGGGMYTKGLCNILGGLFYGNNPSGVHAADGTLSVQGGKFGFKTYPDGSTYTTSINTVSQIVIVSSAKCEFIDTDDAESNPRIISGIEDGESVTTNFGLRNYGTVTIPGDDGEVYFFGKGTSVYNEGTININGNLKILNSPKADETTVQQRRGIHNATGGKITVNSNDFEVKYCGERGIYNQGTFSLKKGSIHHNTSPSVKSDSGGGVYNTGSSAIFTMSGGSVHNNTACRGAGVYNGGRFTISDGSIHDNEAKENGGGLYISTTGDLEMSGGSIYSNKAEGDGGGLYLVSDGEECYITGGSIYKNKAENGGGVASNRTNGLNVEDVKIYDNIVSNHGGGMYTKGLCYILGGFFYGNNPSGVHAADGTLSVQGGKFGFETYPDGSTYTTSINTFSQIVVGSNAECEFIDLYNPRIISGIEDGEDINSNFGLRNYGTVSIPTDGQVYFFGKGTSVYNEGTININGSLKILNSPKAGESTVQQRRGIHNAAGGKVIVNSNDFEIKYCGARGVLNYGTFSLKKGSIHHNTSPSATSDSGGGVYNTGSSAKFTVSGGKIFENQATHGGGIYNTNSGSVSITGGEISYNEVHTPYNEDGTSSYGGGIYNSGKLTVTGGQIHNNLATVDNVPEDASNEVLLKNIGNGGGIFNLGELVLDNASIHHNNAVRGGGIFSGSDQNTFTINNSIIFSNNTHLKGSGGGIYWVGPNPITISNSEIYENSSNDGGGIFSNGTAEFTLTATKVYSNTAYSGGGLMNKGSGKVKISNIDINSNSSTGNGGGMYLVGSGDCTITGSKIHNNSAGKTAGGLYNGQTLAIKNTQIYENTATSLGGGISTSSVGTTNVGEYVLIYKNHSDEGGGGVYNTGVWNEDETLTKDTGVKIYENTSIKIGAGIFNQKSYVSYNAEIYSNNSATNGGGVFSERNTTFNNALIHDNTATSNGGGICSSSNSVLNLNKCSVYSNTASAGAGVYFVSTSKASTISDCDIYENTAKTYGGGVCNGTAAGVTITGGKIRNNTVTSTTNGGGGIGNMGLLHIDSVEIFENTATNGGGINNFNASAILNIKNDSKIFDNIAKTNGGGVFINAGTSNMTGGTIYSNTATKGNGVYLKTNGTFKMSNTALVDNSNIVYLEKDAFITVPTVFTGDKNIRAYVTGANMVTGRVIVKFGDNIDAKGTKALYWNTKSFKENEQYFVVKGKLLRAGNQGAAKTSDAINNQDVFISEAYSVDFDMNPTVSMLFSTVTHTIGEKDYVFDDLMNNAINKNVYQKYWNEELSFDPGRAVYKSAVVGAWSLADDKTAQFTPDTINLIAATINKNIVIIAEWASQIDVDYNGNGATDGDNWTENKVDITEDYQVSDDDTAFTRQQTTRDGNTRLFKFTGWSFEKSAIAKDYAFGATIAADELKSYVVEMEDRERAVATIYAVWDEFPTIKATDRWFTLNEAQNGKITLEELMATAKATDGIVGNRTDFTKALKGSEEFTLIDFNEEDFKAFTTTGNVTVTYKAVDKVGNETYKTIIVHIVDKDEQKYDETTLFTRFISSNYFKNAEGNFIAPKYGGLNKKSKWKTRSAYKSLLTSTLSNTKDTSTGKWSKVRETWIWSIDEITLGKNFVKTHGVGNIENPNALNEFYNQFGPTD